MERLTTIRAKPAPTTTRPAGRPTTGIAGLIMRLPLLRPQPPPPPLQPLPLLPARRLSTTTDPSPHQWLPRLQPEAAAGPAAISCPGFPRPANPSSTSNNTTAPIQRRTAPATCHRRTTAAHRRLTTERISASLSLRPAIPSLCPAPTRPDTISSAEEKTADSTTTPDASNNLTNNSSSTSKSRQ